MFLRLYRKAEKITLPTASKKSVKSGELKICAAVYKRQQSTIIKIPRSVWRDLLVSNKDRLNLSPKHSAQSLLHHSIHLAG